MPPGHSSACLHDLVSLSLTSLHQKGANPGRQQAPVPRARCVPQRWGSFLQRPGQAHQGDSAALAAEAAGLSGESEWERN